MRNLFLLIFISTVSATRLLVPEEYLTIQEGIDAATTGDTVLVNQGIYLENLIIDKTITLTSYAIFEDPNDWAYYDSDWLFQWMPSSTIESTIISGGYNGFEFSDELFINSCISIFSSTGSGCVEPTIMGFTIKDGEGNLYTPSDGLEPVVKGGAFFIHDAIPKINYNYIKDNGTYDFNGLGYSTFAGGAANVEPEDWGFDNTLLTSSREECEISFLDFTHNIYRDNESTVGGVFSNTIGAIVDISGSIVPVFDCNTGEILMSSQYYTGELIAENIEADMCALVIADIYIDPNIDEECMNAGCGWQDNPFKTITTALTMILTSQNNPVTVHLAEGTYSPSTNGETFPIILIDNIHLQGVDQENTIIDAEQTDRVFKLYGINNTTISNLTIKGGYTTYQGGGMELINSSPILTDVIIIQNTAFLKGGGMSLYGSNPTLLDVAFSDNSANYGGGMISLASSSPILTNVTFSNNLANYGGGMDIASSSSTLTNVTFSDNLADWGGGIHLYSSDPILTNVTFNDNSANYGGGIDLFSSNPILTNVTFSNNSADLGGGMHLISSNPTLTNVTFSDNSANLGGGMILSDTSNSILIDVIFNGNLATDRGGGISINFSHPILTGVTFSNNSANYGGGIYLSSSNPTLTDVTISDNSAEYKGGGIYLYIDTELELDEAIISDNYCIGHGAGIFLSAGSDAYIYNSTITGNVVGAGDVFGAGIYADGGSATLINSIVYYNRREGDDGINYNLNGYSGDILDEYNVGYSNVEGDENWFLDGIGNISTDPLYADSDNGDFTLQEGSPCIDTGIADLDGDGVEDIIDYYGSAPDMGAFEYNPNQIGDINNDESIDIFDVILLVNIILNGDSFNFIADINEDGYIDIFDVITMVNIILEN